MLVKSRNKLIWKDLIILRLYDRMSVKSEIVYNTSSLLLLTYYFEIRGRSSAGSPKHSETHPTKNLINKLLSVPFYGGVAQLGAQSTQKRTLVKNWILCTWGISSVGMSAWLAVKRSGVRPPYAPPESNYPNIVINNDAFGFFVYLNCIWMILNHWKNNTAEIFLDGVLLYPIFYYRLIDYRLIDIERILI